MKNVFLLVFLALVLTACYVYYEYAEGDIPPLALYQHGTEFAPVHQENEAENDLLSYWNGFEMRIDPDSVTPTGLRLAMVNNTEFYVGHGVMFSIEQYIDGNWEQVPFISSFGWILPLLIIHPNTISEENIEWCFKHGELPPGQYRLVRNFMNMGVNMWGVQRTDDAYLYALFSVEETWQETYAKWQAGQDDIRAKAYARFDGLDLAILDFSLSGLYFALINNNSNYSYIIHSVFVGWTDEFPEGGHAAALEYLVFCPWQPSPAWPFDGEVILCEGESISLSVDWYYQIGYIYPAFRPDSPNPAVFELVVDVMLDVDEAYIENFFRHNIPDVPGLGLRLTAEFDVSELLN